MKRFDPNKTLHRLRDGSVWPGLDLGGMTLHELRAKVRGKACPGEPAPEVDWDRRNEGRDGE